MTETIHAIGQLAVVEDDDGRESYSLVDMESQAKFPVVDEADMKQLSDLFHIAAQKINEDDEQ